MEGGGLSEWLFGQSPWALAFTCLRGLAPATCALQGLP